MNSYTRRRLLKLGTRTIAGAGLALGNCPALTLARAADSTASQGSDYRALVCVYLEGGCDGFSLMVPTGSYEHEEFAAARGALAIPKSQLISLQGGNFSSGTAPQCGGTTAAPRRRSPGNYRQCRDTHRAHDAGAIP